MEGIIFDVKEFAVHDGPGIRATVFFKGCPLRCKWCHNPEGLTPDPQLMVTAAGCTGCGLCREPCNHSRCGPFDRCAEICPQQLIRVAGERTDAGELADRLKGLSPLLVDGGITISGGEPLMQPEFLLDLLARLGGMDTIVETSGFASPGVFQAAARSCGTVYLDIKHTDGASHRELTGVDNGPILANLDWLKGSGIPFLVRVPLIPGCNDTPDNLESTARLLQRADNLIRVEILPANPFAGAKYPQLGMDFSLDSTENGISPPGAGEIIRSHGVPCAVLST